MTKLFSLALLSIISCNQIKEKYTYREVQDGRYLLKGKMTKDTVFNGEIKYYYEGKLSGIRNYKDGIANGKFINYYENGLPKAIGYEKDGLSDGETVYFSKDGRIIRKDYYYKGRLMGPQYVYDSLGKPRTFSFMNFETQEICTLRYEKDKIKLEDGKLYYHVFSKFAIADSNKIKVFFYLIKPEKIKVDYYVGYVTNGQNMSFEQIEKVNSDKLFFEQYYNEPPSGKQICVKSDLYDSLANHGQTIYGIY
jgi:antitoxin component YwqK of YwqJK toxin-antitoxin module